MRTSLSDAGIIWRRVWETLLEHGLERRFSSHVLLWQPTFHSLLDTIG